MSSELLGKTLPKFFLAKLEESIAAEIAKSLRQDFPTVKIAATAIAKQVETNMETIKKWYNGSNMPSAANLIILARVSPSVRRVVLDFIDGVR